MDVSYSGGDEPEGCASKLLGRVIAPWLGLLRKYVTRPTVPLFLPLASSSCTPYLGGGNDGGSEGKKTGQGG